MTDFSAAEARRIALVAQGFGPKPRGRVTEARLESAIRNLGVLQIDSVNVFERSHYMPMFARLGPYDTAVLDEMLLEPHAPAKYVEYWAHEAAFLPVESWPLWQWKMQRYRDLHAKPGSRMSEHRVRADELLARLHADGPATFTQLEGPREKRTGSWWNWSEVKLILEYLFLEGHITAIGRTNFQRIYAPVADVVPHHLLEQTVSEPDARRALVRDAIRALGIGALSDIADYYRFKLDPARTALRELIEAGEVDEVSVAGWQKNGKKVAGYVLANTDVPSRSPQVTALLSPFDPVTWHRDRASRMFDFDYKIEIYTPAPKRIYGYYSLPILMNDQLVGRIDLKADRKMKTLIVRSAHWEPKRPANAPERLAAIVRDAAAWRGLEHIVVEGWGDAAADLKCVF
jgi:uncharacterized protein YcaQ